MNDQAKIPLVLCRLELFQRVHGDSEFETAAAELATARRNILRDFGRFAVNAAVGADATFRITLGDIRQ
jgi:light-regulated signal transduction histidine kinase (bacteriophytochrome)